MYLSYCKINKNLVSISFYFFDLFLAAIFFLWGFCPIIVFGIGLLLNDPFTKFVFVFAACLLINNSSFLHFVNFLIRFCIKSLSSFLIKSSFHAFCFSGFASNVLTFFCLWFCFFAFFLSSLVSSLFSSTGCFSFGASFVFVVSLSDHSCFS